MQVSAAQNSFLLSNALYRGFVGGRGAGKSWVISYDLLRRALDNRLYMMVSPTYTILADTDFRTFLEMARKLEMVSAVKISPPQIVLHNGAEILFRSADDPERLRGPNLSGVVLNEASLMHQNAYHICIASLRQGGQQGWLTAGFTPRGLGHWTYDVFGKRRPNTEIFHSRTADNPFLPPDFAATLATQYAPQRQRQELGGEFVSIEGAEWPAEYFPPSIWATEWPDSFVATALALDPALGHGERGKPPGVTREPKPGCYAAFAFVGLSRSGHLCVDAWLDRHWTAADLVTMSCELCRRFRPGAFSVETNGGQEFLAELVINEARRVGVDMPIYAIHNFEDKDVRITAKITPFLAQNRFRFRKGSPGAELLVQQMRDFPVGEAKDGPDALQMGVVMLDWLLGQRGAGAQPRAMR